MTPAIFILSTDAPLPHVFEQQAADGFVRAVRQDRLRDDDIASAAALITCVSVDQDDLIRRSAAIARMLDAGGRLAINGHVLRPYVDGLTAFVPSEEPRRADYELSRLAGHPVFDDIDVGALATNRGVAGFYGRGYNPPLPGAVALNGLGPRQLPVDWTWTRPQGGALFVHSGNDLWGVGDDPATRELLAERLVNWCLRRGNAEKAA
ncbi:MAG: hypothetical protein JJ969_10850 [Rhizobiaceae bacterium]|nr:hypothetical protein [Rhizobiaceae bacterium]